MNKSIGNGIVRTAVALLVTATILAMAGSAFAKDLKITVIRQAGKVEAKIAGEKDWAATKPDMELEPGDLLRTLKGGKVQLLFPGDAVVLIKENSLLDIKALLPNGGGKVKAVTGDFLFNLGKALSPGSTFEVESPGALAVVRGTIWAEFLTLDGGLRLVSFDNDVELSAGGETVNVPSGYESEVSPGGTPSDPKPTDLTLEDVQKAFEVAETQTTESDLLLEAWIIELLRLETDVRILHREFLQYYDAENEAGMLLAFRKVPEHRTALDQLDESIMELIEPNDPNVEPIENLRMDNDEIKETLQRIKNWLDEIEYYASMFIPNPDEWIDNTAGLIPENDPSAGIRLGQLDSDGDGLGDALEIALGFDPMFNNALDGFIQTTAPEDGAIFNWPAERAIEFAFEPVESEFVGNYRLWIESGGIQFTTPVDGDRITLSIEALLDPGQGGFARLFDAADMVSFTWFVTGEIETSMIDLGGDRVPAQSITQLISSGRRGFDIRIAEGGTAVLSVVPESPIVQVDDVIRVDLVITTESMLQDVTALLRYDPTILDFEAGRVGQFWQNSLLFFSDSTPGEVGISGRVDATTGFVQGSGVLCELEFRVRGGAGSISPLDLLDALFKVPGGAEVSVLRENALIEVQQPA